MPRVNFGFDAESRPGEHIFLSYSRGDAGRIKKIALELHQMGLPIWYDDGLIPGNIWEDEIMDHVEDSRITVFFLTKELFMREKSYMQDEYQYAVDFRKPTLCIWMDSLGNMDCSGLSREMHKWWNKIRKIHSIEIFDLKTDAEKAKEIYHGLCRADRKFTQYASKTEPEPIANLTAQPATRLNLQVGEKYEFGRYPQGTNGEVQPLVWRVLTVENGRALLIADKLIDAIPYNKKDTDVTWETCTLRKWMNGEFINKAFSSSEQAQITAVTNQNPDNPEYGTKGGNATQDKIFALSIDEVNQYFSNDDDRMAAPTGYAKKRGVWVNDSYSLPSGEKTGYCWLRSPGNNSDDAALVNHDGGINQYGYYVSLIIGAVRPAFWLNL